MELRTYRTDETNIFPIYGITADFNTPQPPIVRNFGYPAHQIFVVNSGSGELTVDGKTFCVEKNDMFFIASSCPNNYSGDENFCTSYLGFAGTGCKAIFNYYQCGKYQIYKNKNTGKFLHELKKAIKLFRMPNNIPALCASANSAVIAFFDEATTKDYSPVEQVYNYLEMNYSATVTLDDILNIYPYSKSKLCKDFSAEYGMSVFEMLNKIRLRNAASIINEYPDIKLRDLSASCGFNDVSYFCKMYKKEFGTSPKSKT